MTASSWCDRTGIRPPAQWPVFACSRCGMRDRRPFPPDDGLCRRCRAAALELEREAELERVRRNLGKYLRAAGVPELYTGFHRSGWEARHGSWSEHAELYRLVGWPNGEASEGLIVLCGGERATWLGTALLGEALGRGWQGVWRETSDWLRALRRGFGAEPRVGETWAEVAESDLLMLHGVEDPAQVETLGPWPRAQLADLLDDRRMHRRPTIVTMRTGSWKGLRRLHPKLAALEVDLKYQIED